jgi:hypothetical protein
VWACSGRLVFLFEPFFSMIDVGYPLDALNSNPNLDISLIITELLKNNEDAGFLPM